MTIELKLVIVFALGFLVGFSCKKAMTIRRAREIKKKRAKTAELLFDEANCYN